MCAAAVCACHAQLAWQAPLWPWALSAEARRSGCTTLLCQLWLVHGHWLSASLPNNAPAAQAVRNATLRRE